MQTDAKTFWLAKHRMTADPPAAWTGGWWQAIKQQIDGENAGYEQQFEQDLGLAEQRNPNAASYDVTRRTIDYAQYGPPPAGAEWGGGSRLFYLLQTSNYLALGLDDFVPGRRPEDVAPGRDLLPISERPIVVTVTTVKVPRPR